MPYFLQDFEGGFFLASYHLEKKKLAIFGEMVFNKGETRRGDVRRTVLGVAAWADCW